MCDRAVNTQFKTYLEVQLLLKTGITALLLSFTLARGALAQPTSLPSGVSTIQQESAIKSQIAAAKDQSNQAKASKAQLQAIRSALKAKLSTLHK